MRAIERLSNEIWDQSGRVGVIDVGSNTVRLVAFDIGGRVPQLVFNEKAFCGLGRNLATTGSLDPDSRSLALSTIHRFVTLAERMGVVHLAMIATAAVREAADGEEFAAAVEQICGAPLKIISGEAEAHYAALGVMSGSRDVDGLIGDLGGGSLELVLMRKGSVGESASLPLGALRLLDAHGDDRQAATEAIEEVLDGVDWLNAMKGTHLYAVGGNWRALARLHMERTEYPLRILHGYEMAGDDARQIARDVSKRPIEEQDLTSVARKRWSTMPMAALVMQRLLKRLASERVTVSAFGLREGVIFDHAPDRLRLADPLIEFCLDAAEKRSRFPAHGDSLMRWIDPLFPVESPRQNRLRYALCLLSDVGWNGHPEYRAEFAMDQVLLSQLSGVDHAGRGFISLGLFIINGGALDSPSAAVARALLDEADLTLAHKVGLALRLGQRISGGTRELLDHVVLAIDGEELILTVRGAENYLLGESVERRMSNLATAMGLKVAVQLDVQDAPETPDPVGSTVTSPS